MLLKMKKYWKNERGFTLIEILAVILIIGLLTAVAVPAVTMHMENAKKKSELQSMLIVKNAAKRFILEQGLPSDNTSFDQTQECIDKIVTQFHYLDAWPTKLDGTTPIGCSITSVGLITITGTTNYGGTVTGY